MADIRALISFCAILFFSGCFDKSLVHTDVKSGTRAGVLYSVEKYLGSSKGGDCSGFIAVVNDENKNIYFHPKELSRYYSDDGRANAIYNLYAKEGKIFFDKKPLPADLIFFGDTVFGKDGGESITHIGIVYETRSDGDVLFAHHIQGANKLGAINLAHPSTHSRDGSVINSFLKKCVANMKKESCLAPKFFRGYGSLE